jgi:formamidopyrimidine-DNA glycosylase
VPELPEVETVVRGLALRLPGRKVLAVENIDAPILGEVVGGVRRYGKFILLDFPAGILFIHLGMTGQLTLSEETSRFTRARIRFDGGILRYDDIRKFGKVFWDLRLPVRGPDPLEMTAQEFAQHAKARRARVKALLLDQRFLRGMGNIYCDESLFQARIHPLAQAAKLSRPRLERLHAAIVSILQSAIAAGGSSISDYVNSAGERGSFQQQHQVYGKAGQNCPRCGTELRRILVVQRGTTFCPKCQKR